MQTIRIKDINTSDKRFCISYPLKDDTLLASIEKVGIVQPLTLIPPLPYTVVSGFKRLDAAINLGFSSVPCIIEKIGERDAALRLVHENAGRLLNIIEKSHCINKMLTAGFSREEIYDAMKLLSLDRHEKIIDRLKNIANADENVKKFILGKALSLKNTESLLKFTTYEKNRIIELIKPLHTTESNMRDILKMFHLVKIKSNIIDFSVVEGTDDIHELKKKLKQIVHPLLSSLENRMNEIKTRCALPPNIDIKVDPFFEKEYIDIVIRAKNPDEVKEALKKLNGVYDAGHIRSIFGLAKD